MHDAALDLLITALNADDRASILWVVDESLSPADCRRVGAKSSLRALTNRCDIHALLRAEGIRAELSDFAFGEVETQGCDAIYYRVSKEKAVVHHIINRAADYLKPGGELVLAGAKQEGIKTYAEKAAVYLGGGVSRQRGRNATMLSRMSRMSRGEGDGPAGPALDDRHYTGTVTITAVDAAGEATALVSKPGIYGWNKIDRGSELLIVQLSEVLPTLARAPRVVADLGCGYGYLSVMAGRLTPACFIATDNNVAAVALCRENFVRHHVQGEVVLADCGEGIERRADLVLCNPPFHQGFAVDGDLTQRFLAAARRLLAVGGTALFVVNSFIPVEKKARGDFSRIDTLVNNGQYKVVRLMS